MSSALVRIEAALKVQQEAQAKFGADLESAREGDVSDAKGSSERKRGVGVGGGSAPAVPARVRGAGGRARALATGRAVLSHGDLVYFTLPHIGEKSSGLMVGDTKLGR